MHRLEMITAFGGRSRHLEHEEVSGDPPSGVGLGRGATGDIVGDHDGAGVDSLGSEPSCGKAEVQHVSLVVAVAEEHPRTSVGRFRGAVDLFGAGAGEHVADDRTVREPRADEPRERGVVSAAAPDHHSDLAVVRGRGGDDSVGVVHLAYLPSVGSGEAIEPVTLERFRRAEGGHVCAPFAASFRGCVVPTTSWSSRDLRASWLFAATAVASAMASDFGGYVGFGSAITVSSAAAAARMPLLESSTARHSLPCRSSRAAASVYTSGFGLPRGTSALDTVAVDSPARSCVRMIASITRRAAEEASATGTYAATSRTMSPAPSSSGVLPASTAEIMPSTTACSTASVLCGVPLRRARYAAHSGALIPWTVAVSSAVHVTS